jgi:WD40 repeat protein
MPANPSTAPVHPSTIVSRIDADYGLLLLSTRCFSRPFIRKHELPGSPGRNLTRARCPSRSARSRRSTTRAVSAVSSGSWCSPGHIDWVRSIAWSPDGSRLATALGYGVVEDGRLTRLPPETFGPSRR